MFRHSEQSEETMFLVLWILHFVQDDEKCYESINFTKAIIHHTFFQSREFTLLLHVSERPLREISLQQLFLGQFPDQERARYWSHCRGGSSQSSRRNGWLVGEKFGG